MPTAGQERERVGDGKNLETLGKITNFLCSSSSRLETFFWLTEFASRRARGERKRKELKRQAERGRVSKRDRERERGENGHNRCGVPSWLVCWIQWQLHRNLGQRESFPSPSSAVGRPPSAPCSCRSVWPAANNAPLQRRRQVRRRRSAQAPTSWCRPPSALSSLSAAVLRRPLSPPFDAVDSVQENRRTDPSTDRYNTNQVQSPTLTPDTTHRHRPATSLKTRTLTINAERCIGPPRTGQKLGTRAGTTRAREPKTCPSVSGKRRLIRPYFHVPTIHGRDVPDSLPDPADLRRQ